MRLSNHCFSSLNFLVYIQNVYVNQNGTALDLFPLFPSRHVHFTQEEAFHESFAKLWKEADNTIASDNKDLLQTEDDLMAFSPLFMDSQAGSQDLQDMFRAFRAWWDSNSMGFRYLMDFLSGQGLHALYEALVASEWQDCVGQHIKLLIIYDEVRIAIDKASVHHLIIPLQEIAFCQTSKHVPQQLLQKVVGYASHKVGAHYHKV